MQSARSVASAPRLPSPSQPHTSLRRRWFALRRLPFAPWPLLQSIDLNRDQINAAQIRQSAVDSRPQAEQQRYSTRPGFGRQTAVTMSRLGVGSVVQNFQIEKFLGKGSYGCARPPQPPRERSFFSRLRAPRFSAAESGGITVRGGADARGGCGQGGLPREAAEGWEDLRDEADQHPEDDPEGARRRCERGMERHTDPSPLLRAPLRPRARPHAPAPRLRWRRNG